MRSLLILLSCCFFVLTASCQTSVTKANTPDPAIPLHVLEVSCGKCKFGLPGKTCALALRSDGNAYYVDGANIDAFGDAHAHDGMCNAIRKAEVQGVLIDNRFKISYIKLLPQKQPGDKE